MDLNNINKVKVLSQNQIDFLTKAVKKNPSLVVVKGVYNNLYLDTIILGDVKNNIVNYYTKYKLLTDELKNRVDNILFGTPIKEEYQTKIRLVSSSNNPDTEWGENSRVSGREYEKLFVENFNSKGQYYHALVAEISKNELQDLNLNEFNFIAEDLENKKSLNFQGDLRDIKADFLIHAKSALKNISLGISLKKTPNRTQVAVHSVDSFITNFEGQMRTKVPDKIKEILCKFCGVSGFTPKELEPTRIVEQQSRNRYLCKELPVEEQTYLFNWLKTHQKELVLFSVFMGGTVDKSCHAQYIISATSPYNIGDTDLPSIIIESQTQVLTKALSENIEEGGRSGTIHIGCDISFQMKGSGDDVARTNIQFQKSACKAS